MVKIRVKLGAAEAEVEADPEHIREEGGGSSRTSGKHSSPMG